MRQPIDSHLHASPTYAILETVDPIPLDFGHLHAHTGTVSYRIQVSSERTLGLVRRRRPASHGSPITWQMTYVDPRRIPRLGARSPKPRGQLAFAKARQRHREPCNVVRRLLLSCDVPCDVPCDGRSGSFNDVWSCHIGDDAQPTAAVRTDRQIDCVRSQSERDADCDDAQPTARPRAGLRRRGFSPEKPATRIGAEAPPTQ
jgi:hypothetical protein